MKLKINDDKRSNECRSIAITNRKGREERKAQLHKSLNSEDIIRQGTRMTRIRRIYTDPCVSVSSAQSVFYIKNDKTLIHSPLAELSACYAKRLFSRQDRQDASF